MDKQLPIPNTWKQLEKWEKEHTLATEPAYHIIQQFRIPPSFKGSMHQIQLGHLVEIILLKGESLAVGGFAGHARINLRTADLLRSFPEWEKTIVLQGEYVDECGPYYLLWYREEYEQRESEQAKIREALRAEDNMLRLRKQRIERCVARQMEIYKYASANKEPRSHEYVCRSFVESTIKAYESCPEGSTREKFRSALEYLGWFDKMTEE